MYEKTHGNIPAGTQKTRYGDEAPFDKYTHVFGFGEQRLLNGAALSIHHERVGDSFPKTVIVKKTIEDMHAVQQDQLGTSKNIGQGALPIPRDTVFGVKNQNGPDTWNAAKCI